MDELSVVIYILYFLFRMILSFGHQAKMIWLIKGYTFRVSWDSSQLISGEFHTRIVLLGKIMIRPWHCNPVNATL